LSQAREVCGQSQAEVADLGSAVGTKPDIAGLDITVDDSFGVRELQAAADGLGDTDCLLYWQAVLRGFLNQALDITARHYRDNDVGLSFMIPDIVDSNNVRVVAEPAHSPAFAGDADSGSVIQFLGLDEGKGHISVKEGVMDKIDLLLTTFTEELPNLITAVDKGGGFG
jgi:hypothetical protein